MGIPLRETPRETAVHDGGGGLPRRLGLLAPPRVAREGYRAGLDQRGAVRDRRRMAQPPRRRARGGGGRARAGGAGVGYAEGRTRAPAASARARRRTRA